MAEPGPRMHHRDASQRKIAADLDSLENEAKKRSVGGGIPGRKDYARDKLTNGTKLLPNVDGRSLIARRFRGIAGAVVADQGGADLCSEARMQLIRRFSATCVLAEALEIQARQR